ncbi:TPA: sulfatase-like hydrolase/transferase, partial [Salmonella enterica subsp. enterica serovar Infantis]|nr:sulfatase-like hydrolase/transferase [Salmonella enterica subsp. enterica serovar Infantis]
KKTIFLTGLLGVSSMLGSASVIAKNVQQPNIVFIMADDLGVETINSYGGQYYTPHIDSLARSGLIFENAHAAPLCTPTRARLMTGIENAKSYTAFGYLDPKFKTFGNTLKEAGYKTGIVGKWQLSGNGFDGLIGMSPKQAGFDETLTWQEQGGNLTKGSRYWGPQLYTNGKRVVNEEGFGPDFMQDFAKNFIIENKEKPFFLYYSTYLPHNPFVPTPDTMNAKNRQDKFAGMISYLDKQVGELITVLKKEGLYDNTIVIFTGDNGTNRHITSYRYGHEVKGGKGLPTLNGTHVPMIFNWPKKIKPNSKSEALFDIMDIYPTLAEIAGKKVSGLDGVSQLPVITSQIDSVRDSIFMHYDPAWAGIEPARFVFNKEWKLYSDGKFVRLNPLTGKETLFAEKERSQDAQKNYDLLKAELDAQPAKAFNPVRFPHCKDQKSLDPDRPAIEAGCKSTGMRAAI